MKPQRSTAQTTVAWWIETAVLVAVAFVFAMLVRTTIAEAYEVPTPSMVPTIQVNDRIIAEKVTPHFGRLERGDIVVIKAPNGGRIPYVKRVIAVAGQTVDVRDGAVWVDGVRLTEPYTHGLPSLPETVRLPITVPADHIWVMGDNRTNSGDSRAFGAVPVATVIGRGIAVYWPPSDARQL